MLKIGPITFLEDEDEEDFCPVFVILSFASVYCCLVVTCWERADLLALVCDV